MNSTRILMLTAALALAFSGGAALADGKGKKNKHRKQVVIEYACPPGLAKKSPPCVPPGLAKKRYDDDDDDEEVVYRWRRGDYIYDDDYRLIDYPNRYTLPPLRQGERYAIVGNQIVKINSETGRILDLMRLLGAITN